MNIKIRAFVLAAGRGTRLKPLTNVIPKPLVAVNGRAVIDYVLDWLDDAGIPRTETCINVHYMPLKIMNYVGPGYIISMEKRLMGTAGALKKMEKQLEDHFVVVNSDTITNVDLEDMFNQHLRTNALATVFTHDDAIHTGGVYIFDKRVIEFYVPNNKNYSIQEDLMPELLVKGSKVNLYRPKDSYYFDIGTPGGLVKARRFFANEDAKTTH